MIRCETPDRMWTIEGKIEDDQKSIYRGEGTYVGIDDLTYILSKYVGKWVRVRVEIIEGPKIYPKSADYPDLPYEVIVVERRPDGEVVHIEVVTRHSLESEARFRAQALIDAAANHRPPAGLGRLGGNEKTERYTVELVTPTGMVKA